MIVVNTRDVEFALTIAAIPVTIVILIMAGYFTRKEILLGMILIIVSMTYLLMPQEQERTDCFNL